MKGWLGRAAIGLAGLASMFASAEARITHIEITKTEPAFGGQSFGLNNISTRVILLTGSTEYPLMNFEELTSTEQ